MPVMAMDDGRIRPFPLHVGERAPGEARETLRIVGKRPFRVSIKPVPIEQVIGGDEFDRNALVLQREHFVARIGEDVRHLRGGRRLIFLKDGAIRG